jgi:hypothetical protein
MPQNPLTLTRQTLYDLVWSKPMSTLAQEFGISDVGLAKRCRAVDVPIPYRGYWARKAAGQEPPRLPLPKYRTRTPTPTAAAQPAPLKEILRDGQEPVVYFDMSTDPPRRDSASNTDQTNIPDRISALTQTPATTVADTCAAVRRTAKHEKHPDRARLPFTAGERKGPIVNLNVSKDTLTRALLLADRFIKTAEAIGWPLTDPEPPKPPSPYEYRPAVPLEDATPPPQYARLLVDGEPIAFLIEERWRQEPRVPTAAELAREKRELYRYQAPRTTSVATGALRIVRIGSIDHWDLRRRTWYDHLNQLVEKKLPQVLMAFNELAEAIKAKRTKDEQEARERAEQERLCRERQERRQAHAQLRAELERQAGAWHRARFLRRYVRAARHSLGARVIERRFLDKQIDFLQWAENYIEQIDPLTATPRNPDQWPEHKGYVCADEAAFKNLLLRVTGFDGHTAQKLNYIDACQSDDSLDDDDDDQAMFME